MNQEMKVVAEPRREIPVAAECDVLVAGGGPAGFGAALAASRTGADTLLIERNGVLGGASTSVLMNAWNCPAEGMTGVAKEVTGKLLETGDAFAGPLVNFDPEALLDLEMEMLLAAGARLLLYTWVAEPLIEAGRVRGVIIQSKSGRQAILAKTVVDTTGDADLAFAAGCPTVKGREEDNKMRPVNTMFRMAGIRMEQLLAYCRERPDQFQRDPSSHIAESGVSAIRLSGFFDEVEKGRNSGELPQEVFYLRFEGVDSKRGIITLNSARVYGVDGTDMWDITRGDIESRKQNRQLFEFVKKHIPGCQDAHVIASSTNLGVRETRRIRGEHLLTDEDMDGEKTYPTSIAKIHRYIVKGYKGHSPDGREGAPEDSEHHEMQTPLRWFEVPYGVLVPQKIDGLTVGGRIISQVHMADMWTRGQYACMVTGQAAGAAAALSAITGTPPRKLDVAMLQKELIKQGVDIGAVGAEYARA
jgi:ribulose 1,5-bisphosphate synthetase/thiazole synthase